MRINPLAERSRTDVTTVSAVAALDGTKPEGVAPFLANLDGTRSRSLNPNNWIVGYHWEFGDGTPGVDKGWVAHTYSQPGTYQATLTATDNQGQKASTAITLIVRAAGVGPQPVIDLYSKRIGAAPHRVGFDATRSYARDRNTWISGYQWSFGDGASSTAGWSAHTYSTPGTYQAKLTVTDSRGLARDETVEIQVCAPSDSTCLAGLGRQRWRRDLCPNGKCIARDMDVDSAGNVLVAAGFNGPNADFGFGTQGDGSNAMKAVVAKYGPDGTPLWNVLLIASATTQQPFPNVQLDSVVYGSNGDAWVSGNVDGRVPLAVAPFNLTGRFVARISSTGTVLGTVSVPRSGRLTADTEGRMFFVDGQAVNLFEPQGNGIALRWSNKYGDDTSLRSGVTDRDGNLLVSAGVSKPGAGFVPKLMKLAPDGSVLWNKQISDVNGSLASMDVGPHDEFLAWGQFDPGVVNWAGSTTLGCCAQHLVLFGKADGQEIWAKPLNLDINPRVGHHGALVGVEQNPTFTLQPKLSAYTRSGVPLWSRSFLSGNGWYIQQIKLQPGGVAVLGGKTESGTMVLVGLAD